MIMLDEWNEDNKLAPLEPVVERAGSTFSSFALGTFGCSLGGAASRMVHWGRWKRPSSSEATDWWANLK